jgi:hypothetical protein
VEKKVAKDGLAYRMTIGLSEITRWLIPQRGCEKMIEWKEYKNESRDIKSHKNHLITDGLNVWIAFHASHQRYGYTWYGEDNEPLILPVTHYAEVNLPIKE